MIYGNESLCLVPFTILQHRNIVPFFWNKNAKKTKSCGMDSYSNIFSLKNVYLRVWFFSKGIFSTVKISKGCE